MSQCTCDYADQHAQLTSSGDMAMDRVSVCLSFPDLLRVCRNALYSCRQVVHYKFLHVAVLSDVAAQRLVEERQASSELTAPSRSTLSEETHHNTAPPLIPRRATTVISSSASVPTAPVTAENMTPCILASRDPGLCRSQQQMVENASMPPDSTHREQEVVAAMQAVQGKMVWATQELKMCSSVELSIQMCNLIKTCAEAITALNDLRSADAGPECTGRQGRCE